ncbi:MAG: helix-turn-helix transcriptional regulator [Treponemataceae bacterium]|nr:helix-turn-helix transcriptional regulator [Treponemataceae bacterium]
MDALLKEILDTFRFNVKNYREKKNWTQRDLSIQIDCSTGAIGSLEAGSSKPSFDLIVKIANAFRVHPALLFISKEELSKIAQENEDSMDRIFLLHIEKELREYLKNQNNAAFPHDQKRRVKKGI